MKLTKYQADLLFRYALAEHFTSPSQPSGRNTAQNARDILRLQAGGLLGRVTEGSRGRPVGAFRLTDAGKRALATVCKHTCAVKADGMCLACGGSGGLS